jgi:hypothetical protein
MNAKTLAKPALIGSLRRLSFPSINIPVYQWSVPVSSLLESECDFAAQQLGRYNTWVAKTAMQLDYVEGIPEVTYDTIQLGGE